MKFRPEIYGMIAVTGLLTGCMSYPPAEKAVTLQQFDSASEAAGQKRAAAFANGFAQALKNGDFSLWQTQMPEHVKSRVDAGIFARMREELTGMFGEFESGRYLGSLQNRDLRDHLWVLRFKKDGNVREIIYLVRIFRNEKGLPEISGFGVKRSL